MPLFCFIIFICVNSVTRTTDTHKSVKTSAGCPARRFSFPVGGLSNEDPPRGCFWCLASVPGQGSAKMGHPTAPTRNIYVHRVFSRRALLRWDLAKATTNLNLSWWRLTSKLSFKKQRALAFLLEMWRDTRPHSFVPSSLSSILHRHSQIHSSTCFAAAASNC